MLYIVKSFGPRNRSILKVGFTNNIERRFYHYVSASPDSQLITTREGDITLESLIHKYLQSLGLQYNKNGRRLEEWFINDPEVLRVFHLSKETIERLVWNNRDRIFDVKIFNSSDYALFKYLYEKHIDDFNGEEYRVVNGKLYKTHAKRVDLDFWKLYAKTDEGSVDEGFESINQDAADFLNLFFSTNLFTERMKAFCEFMDSYKDQPLVIESVLGGIDPKFNNFYSLLGTARCKALKFRESALKNELTNLSKSDILREKVIETFLVGKRYSRKYAKEVLGEIYKSLGITKTPTASDLETWFVLKTAHVTTENGKDRENGFEIISIKPK